MNTLGDELERCAHRFLQDAFAEATASYWNRRAEQFAAVGNERCDRIAEACRKRAAMAVVQDELPRLLCPTCGTETSPWSCCCGETRIGGAE